MKKMKINKNQMYSSKNKRVAKLLMSLSVLIFSTAASTAFSETIQFETPPPVLGTTYSEAGYTLSGLEPELYLLIPAGHALGSVGPASSTGHFAYCGFCNFMKVKLARTDGELFALHSLDFGLEASAEGIYDLIGEREDGTKFHYEYANTADLWRHLSLDGIADFSRLKSLSFELYQGEHPAMTVALDNINVSQVPIPGALPLFFSGLAGLLAVGRRGRKAV
jgi:hypothetical protein